MSELSGSCHPSCWQASEDCEDCEDCEAHGRCWTDSGFRGATCWGCHNDWTTVSYCASLRLGG